MKYFLRVVINNYLKLFKIKFKLFNRNFENTDKVM